MGQGFTIIGQDNQAVSPLQLVMVARVEVEAVVAFTHIPTHHPLVEAAPHIPALLTASYLLAYSARKQILVCTRISTMMLDKCD